MDVLILQVFVSSFLVISSLVLWAISARLRDAEHADRLALFPIADDAGHAPEPPPAAASPSIREST